VTSGENGKNQLILLSIFVQKFCRPIFPVLIKARLTPKKSTFWNCYTTFFTGQTPFLLAKKHQSTEASKDNQY